MALAQKIMDRLLELSTALHTAMVGDLDQHRAVIMGTGHAGKLCMCCMMCAVQSVFVVAHALYASLFLFLLFAGYGLARLARGASAKSDTNMSTQSVTDLTSPGIFPLFCFVPVATLTMTAYLPSYCSYICFASKTICKLFLLHQARRVVVVVCSWRRS